MENGVICIAYRDDEYEGRLMTTNSIPTASPSKNISASGHLFGTTCTLNTGRINGQQQGLGIYNETNFNTGEVTNKMVTTVTFHYPNYITFITTGQYAYEMSTSFKGSFLTFVFT